jgi:molybdopterin synthase catalytic subunit
MMMQDCFIKFYDSKIDFSYLNLSSNVNIGAEFFFVGVIRNFNLGKPVHKVEYNVFESLAVSLLQQKCNYFFLSKNILSICILQRKGVLFVGDINLIIRVSSVDRKSSFHCCRSLVEYIKHCVPIWKKEYYLDSTHTWINSL